MAASRDELAQCEKDLERSRDEASRKEGDAAELKLRVSSLELKLQDAQRAAEDSGAMVIARGEEVEKLRGDLKERDGIMSDQKAALACRDEELTALQGEMAIKDKQHSDAVAEKDGLLACRDQELAEAQGTAREKGEEVVKVQAALEGTRESLHRLQQEHEQALAELAGRESVVAERGSELEKLREDHCRTVAERDGMLASKEEELVALRAEVGEKTAALTGAGEEASRWEARAEGLDERLRELGEEHSKAVEELAGRDARLAALESSLAALQLELVASRDELSDLHSSVTFQAASAADLRDALWDANALESLLVELDRILFFASEEVSSLEAVFSRLSMEFAAKCQEFSAARSAVVLKEEANRLFLQQMENHFQRDLDNARLAFQEAQTAAADARVRSEDLESQITDFKEHRAEVLASVTCMMTALQGLDTDLVDALQFSTSALEDDAECRLYFEQGKSMCDEVEATLDSLQDSVRRVKDEARLRKETVRLLQATGTPNGSTGAREDDVLRDRVEELEAHLQLAWEQQSKAKEAYDSQIAKLEEELAEAALLLQATLAGPTDESRCSGAAETVLQEHAAGPECEDSASLRQLEEMTGLHEKVAAQHARILELEEAAVKAPPPQPLATSEASGAGKQQASASGMPDLNSCQAKTGMPERSRQGGSAGLDGCDRDECEHEEELAEVRDELLRLCTSLQRQDDLSWDDDDSSGDIFDMLVVVERALRLKQLQVEFLTESVVNSPSSGALGTLTAQNAILTAQLAAALDRMADSEHMMAAPVLAKMSRKLDGDFEALSAARQNDEAVRGQLGEMAQLLAAKEKEVHALQLKLMEQGEALIIMNEGMQDNALSVHDWLVSVEGGQITPASAGIEPNGLALVQSNANGELAWTCDERLRNAVKGLLVEREALIQSGVSKDESLATLQRQLTSSEARIHALKEASIEALEQRDATIDALRAVRGAGRERHHFD